MSMNLKMCRFTVDVWLKLIPAMLDVSGLRPSLSVVSEIYFSKRYRLRYRET